MGLEAIKLVDNMHLGGYWPVGDQATTEQEATAKARRGDRAGLLGGEPATGAEHGDQGSRQLTPHPSPPRPDTEQFGPLDNSLTGPLSYAQVTRRGRH